ncbi:MAG: branched chain amino acid ABC transporter substrate-binding protein [Nitrospirae bacterium GWD2_57_9]|nr:MAG: branched chain amino acid ABC transporter substrate-binding protein [Nitrospirae bacterium GWD2_57_9]OGW47546.1 MAG: branched chain amino acid ABC transporter substrate-binding protein [Nitrospirae bacterium GWC2_57_9]
MNRILSLLVMVLLAACSQQDDNVIRIGAAGPMTGDQSKMGIDLRNGVELAVAEWNDKGGLLGEKIVLFPGDDQADPKQAVSVANKFVNQKVHAVVGHWNSNCSINASTYYHAANIVAISPASTNPRLTKQGFKNIFRVCGTDDQQGGVAADFILKRLKPKRVAVIHDKTTYGQGLADYFKKSIEGKVEVVFYDGIQTRDPDYKAILTAIKQKKPEVYFFGGVYPEAGRLVRQAKEVGMRIPMITGDGVYDPTFIGIAGKAAEGTYVTFGKDPSGLPTSKSFNEKYTRKYGAPGPYSIYAYDAANIILTAIGQTGSTDGTKVAEFISKNTFHGAFGETSFDKNGDVSKAPYVMWQVRDGKFVEVQ